MATLPVREETKARLEEVKPPGVTWNQLLEWMLETRTDATWVDLMRDRAEEEAAEVRARRLRRDGALSVTRDADEQVALAEVARRRWEMWEETGRVEETGPRRFRLGPQDKEAPDVRVRRIREGP